MFATNNPPHHLFCPISQQIYFKPVTVFPSGHVYEKEIVDHLIESARAQSKQALCALTRMPIENYVEAWKIAAAVDDYLRDHPNARSEQYKPINANLTKTVQAEPASNQLREDATMARELTQQQIREEQDGERERRSHAAYIALLERERRRNNLIERVHLQTLQNRPTLTSAEERERDLIVREIQDIIFALGFEAGPKRQGRINNPSLLFFALIEQGFLKPMPWQKIKISKGPKTLAMYDVLKAAIRALNELDPEVLTTARSQHARQYDRVKTLRGEFSLGQNTYASVAHMSGTIKNQPGDLVNQVLLRVNYLLAELCRKYPAEVRQNMPRHTR